MTIWFIGGFLALVIIGVTAAYVISGGAGGSVGSNANSTSIAATVPAVSTSDWAKGDKSAKVSIIEYGDFECPACAAWSLTMDQMIKDYGNRISFVFRNYPLYQIHPDGQISSEAAEAAGLQGKYWEMHDLLYQKQLEWSIVDPTAVVQKYFDGYAQSLGLDVNKFNQDINSNVVINKIQTDAASGNAAQIDHTPTFFVNLKEIQNPASYADFRKVIDQALAVASTTNQ